MPTKVPFGGEAVPANGASSICGDDVRRQGSVARNLGLFYLLMKQDTILVNMLG
jgi:hypothetical protein